jgi:hypothetical protein
MGGRLRCGLEADISAMTMAPPRFFDHGCREIDTCGPTLGLGPIRHDEDVLAGPASDIERSDPGLKAQDVEAPTLGPHDGGSPSSGIEVIDELATGARGVNVTERGAGRWQIRHKT